MTGPRLPVALLIIAAGCAGSPTAPADRSAGKGRPTEAETREAYLDTALVTAEEGRLVVLGAARAEVVDVLGAPSAFTYRRGRAAPYVDCVVYPIAGTQRRDVFGGIEADEWEFCFASGRLTSKRRIPAGE
jgi:hypothetical protein